MGKLKDLISLLRVRQWYKTGVVLAGPLFAGVMFDFSLYPALFLVAIVISLASSFNYVMNDLIDIEADRRHPEKAVKRPIAAGRISKGGGVLIMICIGAITLVGSFFLNVYVFGMVIAIIINGILYNFIFKQNAFVDILSLSLLYIWRALAGCFILGVYISPWLIVGIFLIALFLVVSKRRADLELLGEDAPFHKKVYDQYSMKMLDNLHIIILTSVFIVYMLYIVQEPAMLGMINRNILLCSLPVMLYLLMQYSHLMLSKPEIARNTERVIFDKGILIGGAILGLILVIAFYFPT